MNYMSIIKYELINAFNQEPTILQEDLVSLKLGVKKRNGERFAKATTSDGDAGVRTKSWTKLLFLNYVYTEMDSFHPTIF